MARRLALEILDGAYVNLGIGLPELVTRFTPPGRDIFFHTENGMIGMGPEPDPGAGDPDLINAGKRRISTVRGAAYFHQADSFAMIRGGHIDLCVLGAMQVSENGDLANWSTGAEDAIPSVGGAMDLVVGVANVFVLTQHCAKDGARKLVTECSYPLTGRGVVTKVFTDLAVIDVDPHGFALVELAPGVTFEHVQQRTGASLRRLDR
jgi:3-oxoadipate CoA-transferase, beta subunit